MNGGEDMKYYTSDLHLFHPGLAKIRGFKMEERMDLFSFLKPEDELYILGDVGYGYKTAETVKEVTRLLGKVRCRKHLIVGNHDAGYLEDRHFRKAFVSIKEHMLLHDEGHDLYLSHYPLVEWDGYYKGRWLFYGHLHEKPTRGPGLLMDLVPTAVNVGIDFLGRPMTAEEIIAKRRKEWRMPDIRLADAVFPKIDPSLLNGKKGIANELLEFAGVQEGSEPGSLSCPEKTGALDLL